MAWLKKIDPSWVPAEKRDLQVGEIWEFNGPFEALVKGKMAILVDAEGNEQELPGQKFTCPICFADVEGLLGFTEHVATHKPTPKAKVESKPEPAKVEEKPVAPVVEVKAGETPAEAKPAQDEARAKRLAALEKARQARMAKEGNK